MSNYSTYNQQNAQFALHNGMPQAAMQPGAYSQTPPQHRFVANVAPQVRPSQYFATLPQSGAQGGTVGSVAQQSRANGQRTASGTAARASRQSRAAVSNASRDSLSIEEQIMSELRRDANENRNATIARSNSAGEQNRSNVDNDDENDDDGEDAEGADADDDGDVDPSDAVYNLPPPPCDVYATFADLETALHSWTADHGYDVVSRHTRKNAAGLFYKRSYACSKHGVPTARARNDRPRRIRSARIGCPMALLAVACEPHDPAGSWTIKITVAHHNHPAAKADTLAGHRRRARTGAVEEAVDGLLRINASLPDIHKFLSHAHPGSLITKHDLSNLKMRFLKFGTCSSREGTRYGRPFCRACLDVNATCNGRRPVCERCAKTNTECHYEESNAHADAQMHEGGPVTNEDHEEHDDQHVSAEPDQLEADQARPSPSVPTLDAREFHATMKRLRTVAPSTIKLTLESSEVEYLAAATCGAGTSYRDIAPLINTTDPSAWAIYSRAFQAAARAENTYDVLIGQSRAPAPLASLPASMPVQEYNEIVKQTAIYRRRNSALVAALFNTLSPAVCNRIAQNGVSAGASATEMWRALEHAYAARGSEGAYTQYISLMSVSLKDCEGGLSEYISVMHERWRVFQGYSKQDHAKGDNESDSNGDAFICFHFLAGLGPEHRRLVDSVCRKNNVGGTGSGTPLRFKALTELVKGAMQWQAEVQEASMVS